MLRNGVEFNFWKYFYFKIFLEENWDLNFTSISAIFTAIFGGLDLNFYRNFWQNSGFCPLAAEGRRKILGLFLLFCSNFSEQSGLGNWKREKIFFWSRNGCEKFPSETESSDLQHLVYEIICVRNYGYFLFLGFLRNFGIFPSPGNGCSVQLNTKGNTSIFLPQFPQF